MKLADSHFILQDMHKEAIYLINIFFYIYNCIFRLFNITINIIDKLSNQKSKNKLLGNSFLNLYEKLLKNENLKKFGFFNKNHNIISNK